MPVILPKIYEQLWIDSSAETENILSVLKPYPDSEMQMYRVSPIVNSSKNDTPDVIKKL